MSHPPECENILPDGVRCGRWVDEPKGAGTAERKKAPDGKMLYLCGECSFRPNRERGYAIGRNDPCPCGSGLKYKKCCR